MGTFPQNGNVPNKKIAIFSCYKHLKTKDLLTKIAHEKVNAHC
jgi:hypothetical protein